MEMSPQQVRTATFNTTKRGGYDPGEVGSFLRNVASALESAQNQAAAMEARARAAVARLNEQSAAPSPTPDAEPKVAEGDAEVISRTLVLAQRTADSTIADARSEAERLVAAARDDARAAGEDERRTVVEEVQALAARRDFLEADVDHLQQFLVDERSRLRDAAASLLAMVERVPDGLGRVRPPILSASGDPTGDATATGESSPFAGTPTPDATERSPDDPVWAAAAGTPAAAPPVAPQPSDVIQPRPLRFEGMHDDADTDGGEATQAIETVAGGTNGGDDDATPPAGSADPDTGTDRPPAGAGR